MIRRNSRLPRLLAVLVAVSIAGPACGGKNDTQSGTLESTTTSTIPKGPDTVAARLHKSLDALLQEHVALAAATTGAALGGRGDEFTAVAGALDANSDALTAEITAASAERLALRPGEAVIASFKATQARLLPAD